MPLDQTEIRDLFYASQRILSAGNLEELGREALLILQNLFQADKGNFFLATEDLRRSSIDLGKVFTRGVTDKSFRLFRQYYHQLDPFKKVLNNQGPPPQVVTFKQIIPFAKLLKTEYYNDFLKPQNIHDQLAIYLMSGNQFLGVTALFRPKDSPVFSSADSAKAKLIAPILTAALERAISMKKSRELEQAIHSVAIDLPYEGIVILDTSLKPVYHNTVAAGIISRLHRLNGQNRSFPPDLPGPLHSSALRLASSLQGAMPKKLPRIEPLVLTESSAKRVTAHLRVVINEKNIPLILICFNPTNQTSTTDTLLKQQGISPRELDIIHLLADGKKNSEIAEALFISEYTVENHLRAIYRKMGVKNRTALVHKLYTTA